MLSVKQLQLFCNLPPLLFDQFNYSLAKSRQNQTDLRRSDLPAMETTMDVSVAVQSHCSAISWTTLFYQSALSHPKPPNVHVLTLIWHFIPREQPLTAIDVLTRSVTAIHHVKAAFNIFCRGRLFCQPSLLNWTIWFTQFLIQPPYSQGKRSHFFASHLCTITIKTISISI